MDLLTSNWEFHTELRRLSLNNVALSNGLRIGVLVELVLTQLTDLHLHDYVMTEPDQDMTAMQPRNSDCLRLGFTQCTSLTSLRLSGRFSANLADQYNAMELELPNLIALNIDFKTPNPQVILSLHHSKLEHFSASRCSYHQVVVSYTPALRTFYLSDCHNNAMGAEGDNNWHLPIFSGTLQSLKSISISGMEEYQRPYTWATKFKASLRDGKAMNLETCMLQGRNISIIKSFFEKNPDTLRPQCLYSINNFVMQ
jgi:hypothetical protein